MAAPVVLPDLKRHLTAQVLRPGDPDYDSARAIWNGRPDRSPAAIVRCRTAAEVVECIRAVRNSGTPVSIRGTGHHTTGDALSDGGITIDLSLMDRIGVQPEERIATLGPGVRARDLNAATQPHGLAATTAPITTCGMAGYTLGGGLGWIARSCGLSCDNLLSAEVVTADGRLVTASENQNPDLFWALRGGSGNFGVVTALELRLHPVGPEVLSGQMVYRMEDAAAALRAYRDLMPDVPDEFTCMPVLFQLPPIPGLPADVHGATVLALVPFYAGSVADGLELIRPLREAGRPLLDTCGPAVYETLLMELDEMYRGGDRNAYTTAFLDALPDDAIDAFLATAAPVPTAKSSIFIEWFGGAIARRPSGSTAYPHRERRLCVTTVPKWENTAQDAEMVGWAQRVRAALDPFAAPGAYVNYLDRFETDGGDSGDALARAAYGASYDRLAEIKRRWDPDNLFRSNHNVRPAP